MDIIKSFLKRNNLRLIKESDYKVGTKLHHIILQVNRNQIVNEFVCESKIISTFKRGVRKFRYLTPANTEYTDLVRTSVIITENSASKDHPVSNIGGQKYNFYAVDDNH